jgi:hypothetical protein
MLNAAWKGYQRGQDIGVSWILSESHSGRISTEAKEAKRIAQQVVSRLKELGFGAELRPDPDTYMTVSKEGNSFKTTLVYQLSVQLSHIQRGDVKTLRKEMFGGWQDLPRKERRRGYKRKVA